jgi:hypothetical protein
MSLPFDDVTQQKNAFLTVQNRPFHGRNKSFREFQITMNDTLRMQIARKTAFEVLTSRAHCASVLFVEAIEQIAAVTQFLDNIDFAGTFVDRQCEQC